MQKTTTYEQFDRSEASLFKKSRIEKIIATKFSYYNQSTELSQSNTNDAMVTADIMDNIDNSMNLITLITRCSQVYMEGKIV